MIEGGWSHIEFYSEEKSCTFNIFKNKERFDEWVDRQYRAGAREPAYAITRLVQADDLEAFKAAFKSSGVKDLSLDSAHAPHASGKPSFSK